MEKSEEAKLFYDEGPAELFYRVYTCRVWQKSTYFSETKVGAFLSAVEGKVWD